ncbi:hypothetical protein [Bradyrhizobium sp. AUGA SZCCT0283]|uniref:hypothetical protein n=1 Tax=Bradyrhizobium sp. AUGA SZCCT0283 TaxID=2807671 RepID=UPI001BA6C9E4|nr:hypothetical protein [Bradyrhizobium sp. AUGA SZCCT0283]MBR1273434.1 hypothetical protein [Bradyrhizobium sp. AUGA SZCCT0283]
MTQVNDGRGIRPPTQNQNTSGAGMNRVMIGIIAAVGAAIAASGAIAQSQPLPTPLVEEVMVKTTLLTLNDANLTGNYDVMHAKMAGAFREKFGPDTLKQAFTTFAGKHVDVIAATPLVTTREARIGSNGVLMLRGYFDTTPSRLNYELDYAISEGEWKLIAIDVKVKGPSTSYAGAAGLLAHATADFPMAIK